MNDLVNLNLRSADRIEGLAHLHEIGKYLALVDALTGEDRCVLDHSASNGSFLLDHKRWTDGSHAHCSVADMSFR